ncbi:MAG TPA: galactose-1-phosphate uridylyltransferase [Acidimicrobiales bacterium]|nr:galactose-1-phosphate uridylyltransferase [Acidimicrobiales bacterium]
MTDGREVFYFTTRSSPFVAASDRRRLGPVQPVCELRHDPLLGTWVMYGAHRQDRSYLPTPDACPFCPSAHGREGEVPAPEYEVVVFENRFPSLADTGDPELPEDEPRLMRNSPGRGRCEVICYTSDHNATFADLGPERVALVIDALVDRSVELGRKLGVEQVFCFENSGKQIGVTQTHPHGQIYAYPFVTRRTRAMLASARAYRQRTGGNLFDDLVSAESNDGSRVVISTDNWVAFVPHAARWPYEAHLYPRQRRPDLAALSPAQRAELPEVLLDLYGRFARLFGKPSPYIAGWHQAPVRQGRPGFACHLELFTFSRTADKLKYLAGSEAGMDAFANDVLPEAAAAALRAAGGGGGLVSSALTARAAPPGRG